ncbi:MAG: hypothetical protein ACKVQV_03270 [Bacteroidia bacterium]
MKQEKYSFFQQDPYFYGGYAGNYWFLLPFARDNDGNWQVGKLVNWQIALLRKLSRMDDFKLRFG